MDEDRRHLRDHERVDEALKAAFSRASGSALDAIERLSGTRSRILLRDAGEVPSPVLRMPRPAEGDVLSDDERYQVLGEIGRGGMGTVYKGRDKDLGRDVALKVLRGDLASQEAVVQRFVEEAQVGGQLQHPGIVPIYGLGLQPDGRPYFAMKLVKGETLAALLEGGTKASELVGVFERVAQALAYAHSRGVIHRDLKPSNVMVGAFGEVHVVDWGFAKVLGHEAPQVPPGATMVATVRTGAIGSQSIAGSVMGTPAYMPPEQALGQVDALTARSDVFALGAILCEILTLQPPYTGTMQDQLLAASQARLDEAYERLDACIAPDGLKQLARDCLQPLPKDRPKDAGVVAQRVADHLASVEERARRADLDAVHAAAEARRVQRARRTTVGLAALALATIVGGALGVQAWTASERARADAASAEVSPLLLEATRLEGVPDLPAASAKAASALALAQAAGADAGTLATARTLSERLAAAAAAADAEREKARREAQLIDALDEAAVRSRWLDATHREAAFATPFEAFGVDPDAESAPQALSGFDRKAELALHLDTWAEVRRGQKNEGWRALHRLAGALDDDPWRSRLREAAVREDRAALLELAEGADLAERRPATIARLGVALTSVDEPEAAVAMLRRASLRHPGAFWIRQVLATVLGWKLRRAEEGIPHAQAALALRPNSASTWNTLGAMRNDGMKDHVGAERAFRRAIQLVPEYGIFHGNLGMALQAQGRIDEAIAAYREALRLDPKSLLIRNNLGALLCDVKRQYDAAIAEFREAIRLDADDPTAHDNLAIALREKGDLDGAIASAREAVRLGPENARHFLTLADPLIDKGDLDGAIAAASEAVRLAPENARAYGTLGRARLRDGDFTGAFDAVRRSIELDPDDPRVLSTYGIVLGEAGDAEGAITVLRSAIRLAPNLLEPYGFLVDRLKERGDLAGAIEVCREMLRIDPSRAEAHLALGQLLFSINDFKEAIPALREAIRRDASVPVAHYVLGLALKETGDYDGALAAQRAVLHLDPKHARAQCNIGIVLMEKGDVDGAIAAQRAAIRLDPNLAPAHCNLGIELAAKGDYAGAAAAHREALRADPTLGPAYFGLGFALLRSGDLEGSLDALRRGTEAVPADRGLAGLRTQVEQVAALVERLPGVLRGDLRPAGAEDWLAFASVAFLVRQYPASVRCWREAFAADPRLEADLGSGHRYNAACAAALAGAETHAQALAWLRADLAALGEQLPAAAPSVIRALRHWKTDPDLSAVRDVDPLPEAWRRLWADADALLARAQEASR